MDRVDSTFDAARLSDMIKCYTHENFGLFCLFGRVPVLGDRWKFTVLMNMYSLHDIIYMVKKTFCSDKKNYMVNLDSHFFGKSVILLVSNI